MVEIHRLETEQSQLNMIKLVVLAGAVLGMALIWSLAVYGGWVLLHRFG